MERSPQMRSDAPIPTPYPDVNAIVRELTAGIQAVLGDQVIGIYLDGSLANGDFDSASDIDFVVVTRTEVSNTLFLALRDMHAQISAGDSPWALQLEGSYISEGALRRFDPACCIHPNIERGPGERLKMAEHDEGWMVHRHILRERGIVVSGPPPQTLIDPSAPDDLRQAARSVLRGWATRLLERSDWADADGYHSYIVLTLCRILYTIATGAVASKRASVEWARSALAGPWRGLVERAWLVRQTWHERLPDTPSIMVAYADETRGLIRYAIEQASP